MKMRLTTNSIRLRLGRAEVERIGRGEAVVERVGMSPEAMTFRLEVSADQARIKASFAGGEVVVSVPPEVARAWAGGSEVGIEAVVAGQGGAEVRVLIEKDFHCLHGDRSDQADCFPNPAEG